jgi:hypothetical protein
MLRWWLRTANSSICCRLMPNFHARFSAVWPISRPTTGSVRPFIRPMTGVSNMAGRSFRKCCSFWPAVRSDIMPANQRTIASEYSSGARDRASTPPASTSSERPHWMLAMAESMACMPEAQLRITVQPGTFLPQPRRSATMRPIFVSSGDGAAQPRITSPRSDGSNGWRSNSARPAWVAKSEAANGPGPFWAFRNGVRAPSTT